MIMMINPMLPMAIVPMTFLFVLLIILIVKAPKAGACVVGGLVLLTPLLVWRLAIGGALHNEQALPAVVVPVTFLFVLMIVLLTRMPKVGVTLIVVLMIMGVAGAVASVGLFTVSHRETIHQSSTEWHAQQPPAAVRIVDEPGTSTDTYQGIIAVPTQSPVPLPPGYAPVEPVEPASTAAASPIWAPGVEREFSADVYPSRLAAARSLGLRMDASLRKTVGEPNASVEMIIFQEGAGRDFVAEFTRSLEEKMPDLKHSVEADSRNIRPGEVGVTFRLDASTYVVNYSQDSRGDARYAKFESGPVESGGIVASVFTTDRRVSVETRFIEKPWVEGFAAFASTRPGEQFVVARSVGTCTSESEANQQALEDARGQIAELVSRSFKWQPAVLPQPQITPTDILRGGFIVDRFTQSFEGSAGRIWRQAMLIDVSGSRLAQLGNQKAREVRSERMSWARMGSSAVGVIVLIGVIYFFLNMATRGYYEWSLRIAGVVLAVVAVISVLMVVR